MEKTINFRISKELKDELQFIAEEKEIKTSNLVREIITDFIENYYENEDNNSIEHQEPIEIFLNVPRNYNHNQ